MLQSGTTTIGAISSYGFDMLSCVNTPLRVFYFSEAIGSRADMVDALWTDFNNRLQSAITHKHDRFIPAVAIHSPYSVHPILIKKLIALIHKERYLCSTHFLESLDELQWLQQGEGRFKDFFATFFKEQPYLQQPLHTIEQFLDYFKEGSLQVSNALPSVLLAHGTFLDKLHCDYMSQHLYNPFALVHCPHSNRLLTNAKLPYHLIECLHPALGTDGLSSNNSLSLFDELRVALSIHSDIPLKTVAQELMLCATRYGAKALTLDSGEITVGKKADIIYLTLPQPCAKDDLIEQIILHTHRVQKSFIDGELCYV